MTSPFSSLTALGQSIWYDNIQRRLLENGELAGMIARGEIRGVTSNPSIFHNAISKTSDYDSALLPLAWAGWSAEDIFWQLAVEDIVAACDLFRPLYEETDGTDGYVSLEVSPLLANNTAGTVKQAALLWERVNRPNLMIKIPATKAGLPAIRQTIAAGINVNVTLIFSLERYAEVMEAYMNGLEDRLLAGGDIERIHSVASFFISRVDSKIDAKLPADSPLQGKTAIANAKLAYKAFQEAFATPYFGKLQLGKANFQRPLWASTSTKNPAYPDTLYVDELIGPATVNTVPPATLDAFRDHGKVAATLQSGMDEAAAQIAALEAAGISMKQVTDELEAEGVKAFEEAFIALLASLEERRLEAVELLVPLTSSVQSRLAELERENFIARFYDHDPTLWEQSDAAGQAEIRQRLGWLTAPETFRPHLDEYTAFAEEIRQAGFTDVILIGMGGSSLAPEVLSRVFNEPNALKLTVLDSTDPAQVLAADRSTDPRRTLHIVASKSGGTAEVTALLAYFWTRAQTLLGEQAGDVFIAITDPATALEKMATERKFRRAFLSDPQVGGRYSALTPFGLVPAALLGIDLNKLVERAARFAAECARDVPPARNPGFMLGVVLGQAALEGVDKLSFFSQVSISPLVPWLEQLIAESTGKDNKGILPVDEDPENHPGEYGDDRLFVYLRGSGRFDKAVDKLDQAGYPSVVLQMTDPYNLGAEFYRWEFATAVACAVLRVNAFDQPDVQDNKVRTLKKIEQFKQDGELEEDDSVWADDDFHIYSPEPVDGEDLPETLADFLARANPGDYIAINAYLPRDERVLTQLEKLRAIIRSRTTCPVTLGFGPRFLHSTGQYHKGGPDTGLFLQITANPGEDCEIPGQGMTFGTLQRAQALGDYEALNARGRRILRLHLPSPESLRKVVEQMKGLSEDEV
jgi:transaldolase / glucose-6-phosphate isomerase